MEPSQILIDSMRRSGRKVAFSRSLVVRLKIAVLVVACVSGVVLGFASAALGPRLLGEPRGFGRTVTLQDFQVILQRQPSAETDPATTVPIIPVADR
jgi:hypothetical protein